MELLIRPHERAVQCLSLSDVAKVIAEQGEGELRRFWSFIAPFKAAIGALQLFGVGREPRPVDRHRDAIDGAVFDLKAVNPNAIFNVDTRTTAEIVKSIEDRGRIIEEAMATLKTLLPA